MLQGAASELLRMTCFIFEFLSLITIGDLNSVLTSVFGAEQLVYTCTILSSSSMTYDGVSVPGLGLCPMKAS